MLSRLSLCLLAVGLLLFVIQQALGVMPYYGIEDYLGWIKADAIKYMNDAWVGHNIRSLASLYLWVDTALFMPIYGMFLLELGRQLFAALASDSSGQFSRLWANFYTGLLATLLIVDLVENVAGLAKVSAGFAEPLLCVLLSFVIWFCLVKWFQDISPSASQELKLYCLQLRWPPLIVALVVGCGLIAVQGIWDNGKCFLGVSELHDRVGCLAHQAKVGVLGVGLVGFLALFVLSA